MHQSRALSILKTLSGKELRQFEQYLETAQSKDATYNLTIFRQLVKYAPAYESTQLQKARFLRQLPADENWDRQKLSYQLSKLTAAVESFLAQQAFQDKEWEKAVQLYRIGQDRALDYLVRKAEKRIVKWLERYPLRDRQYYLCRYEWAALQQQFAAPHERGHQPVLQQLSRRLDQFFTFEKTQLLWEMANLEAMLEVEYDYGLGEALQDWLEQRDGYLQEDATLSLYWHCLKLATEQDPERSWPVFLDLQQLYRSQQKQLAPEDTEKVFTGLLNYCTRWLNITGEQRYRRAYFELNKQLLSELDKQPDPSLSHWRYINLVSVALALEEQEWARDFIKTFRSYLPSSQRDNAYHYAMGQYYYHKGELQNARREIAQVAFEEPLFNAGVRLLLSKVLYDAGAEELLLNQLEANRLFLLRDHTIDDARKAQLQTFNTYLRRLVRTPAFEQESLQELEQELPDATFVISRDWLLQRIRNKQKP